MSALFERTQETASLTASLCARMAPIVTRVPIASHDYPGLPDFSLRDRAVIKAKNTMASARTALGFGVFSLVFAMAAGARADAPWVDRAITLPGRSWAFNFGLGIGHVPETGIAPGFNLEGGVSIAHGVEIGLRTGIRPGNTAREAQADVYGRPFDTETYGTGVDTIANPEFYLRARLIESQVVEVGIEGRVYAPFSVGFGLMAGVPLAF